MNKWIKRKKMTRQIKNRNERRIFYLSFLDFEIINNIVPPKVPMIMAITGAMMMWVEALSKALKKVKAMGLLYSL